MEYPTIERHINDGSEGCAECLKPSHLLYTIEPSQIKRCFKHTMDAWEKMKRDRRRAIAEDHQPARQPRGY